METLLEVKNVSRSFGRQKVLSGVSLTVQEGQLVGITGENGSGKSTLLHIITGLQKADTGSVCLAGKMGYCPQELWLFDQLTIFEHFSCWAVGYDLPEKVWKKRMEFLVHRFRFGQHLHKKVAHLSGGTKQKLNLTLALLHEPSLLVLDEPYAGFDWETYLSFWEYSSEMVKKGHSILIVSHFIEDRQKFQHVYNLQNGVLV